MPTPAVIYFYNHKEVPICCVAFLDKGYPNHLGISLATFLAMELRLAEQNIDMEELATLYVKTHDGCLVPPVRGEHGYPIYEYHVYKRHIRIVDTVSDRSHVSTYDDFMFDCYIWDNKRSDHH